MEGGRQLTEGAEPRGIHERHKHVSTREGDTLKFVKSGVCVLAGASVQRLKILDEAVLVIVR